MIQPRPFSELVEQLLRDFQLIMPPGPAQEVYTLHFDGQPSVHLIGRTGTAYIDLVTEAAQVPDLRATEPLLTLLELNAWDNRGYPATIMLHRASRTVIVGARQLRAAMDVALLKLVLDGVRRQADAVRQRLDGIRLPPGARNAGSLPWMAPLPPHSRPDGDVKEASAPAGARDPVKPTGGSATPVAQLPQYLPAPFAPRGAHQGSGPATHASSGEPALATSIQMISQEVGLAAKVGVDPTELPRLIPKWVNNTFQLWHQDPDTQTLKQQKISTPQGSVNGMAGEKGKALYDEFIAYQLMCRRPS